MSNYDFDKLIRDYNTVADESEKEFGIILNDCRSDYKQAVLIGLILGYNSEEIAIFLHNSIFLGNEDSSYSAIDELNEIRVVLDNLSNELCHDAPYEELIINV